MDPALRKIARERAQGRCEYCHLHEDDDRYYAFHLEHITARQHQGGDEPENLAWSCHHCNLHKGTNLTAIDPETLQVVMLFHPRRDRWEDNFELRGPIIIGKTACRRATLRLLKINAPYRVELRAAL
jgi:5-methylcytosine-specific restriction endonuclease McrA